MLPQSNDNNSRDSISDNNNPSRLDDSQKQGKAQVEENQTALSGIRSRLGGIVSQGVSSKRLLLVGAGSVGSTQAELLVRSGVQNLVVIDPDSVGIENLSRTVYTAKDIGQPKVEALKHRLLQINPDLEYVALQSALQDIALPDLDSMAAAADLVIATTDDPKAQSILNHLAYARRVPAIFTGIYRKGAGGEVIFTIPTITPCLSCCTPHRSEAQKTGELNYGTGRLNSEPALGADIWHIVTASVKLAIGLLEITEEAGGSSRELVMSALGRGSNYLQLSTSPNFFADAFFADVPGQLAYQSLWWSANSNPSCTVCGTDPVDPAEIKLNGPDIEALAKLLAQAQADTIETVC